MSGNKYIVIGFTPYHLMVINEVVELLDGEFYVFHPMASSYADLLKSKGVVFFGGCERKNIPKFIKYIVAGFWLRFFIFANKKLSVVIPHPYNPLANLLFFSDKIDFRYIYEDGILNYYDSKIPPLSFLARVKRFLVGISVGAVYKSYDGHLSGIDARNVSGGFFSHPNKVVKNSRFPVMYELFRSKAIVKDESSNVNSILFLDQPIDKLLSYDKVVELRSKVRSLIDSISCDRVYYKPHHDQNDRTVFNESWCVIGGDKLLLPAEVIVSEYSISVVVSFCTSALVNIVSMNNNIKCYAVGPDNFPISRDGLPTTLGELFREFGIIVLD